MKKLECSVGSIHTEHSEIDRIEESKIIPRIKKRDQTNLSISILNLAK